MYSRVVKPGRVRRWYPAGMGLRAVAMRVLALGLPALLAHCSLASLSGFSGGQESPEAATNAADAAAGVDGADPLEADGSSEAGDGATVYEDGEDGTVAGWEVYDSVPSGATITNVFAEDRQSRVIQFSGAGTDNGYRLTSPDGGKWQNTTQFVIEWSMSYSEPYTLYVDVDTTAGHRYLEYLALDRDGLGTGEYVRHGLGSGSIDGRWQTYRRDLQADLAEAQPDVRVVAVTAFLIRGSGRVDDIRLTSP